MDTHRRLKELADQGTLTDSSDVAEKSLQEREELWFQYSEDMIRAFGETAFLELNDRFGIAVSQ